MSVNVRMHVVLGQLASMCLERTNAYVQKGVCQTLTHIRNAQKLLNVRKMMSVLETHSATYLLANACALSPMLVEIADVRRRILSLITTIRLLQII